MAALTERAGDGVVPPPLSAFAVPGLAVLVPLGISAATVLSSDRFYHWFILPVTACGILIGWDAARWALGRVDLVDPVGVIGVYGFFFYFLAPLLHVAWDHWMRYVIGPADWRPLLGGMAVVNLCGLALYRWTVAATAALRLRRVARELHGSTFAVLVIIALGVAAAAYAVILLEFGGVAGLVETFERQTAAFSGKGWLLVLAESFPLVAALGMIELLRRRRITNIPTLLAGGALFVMLVFVFAGFRGSRSAIVFPVLWAGGMVHVMLRPVRRSFLIPAIALCLAFMYFYGFYKNVGRQAVQALESAQAREVLVAQTGRSLRTLVLGDFGRSDVQALLLDRLYGPAPRTELAWGRTYVAGVASVVPRALWPGRPLGKIVEGTEALYGVWFFLPERYATNVYGLAGEALLNFGAIGAVASFAFLGVVVGSARRFSAAVPRGDPRGYVVPLVTCLCLVVLIGDLDNVAYGAVQHTLVPGLVLWLSMGRARVASTPS
jgi:hypothetical protein